MSNIPTIEDKSSIGYTEKVSRERMFLSFALILLSYLLALAAGIGVGYLLQGLLHPILLTFIADVVATIVVYIFSVIFTNTSFYDPYWSVQPIVIAIYWFILSNTQVTIRQLLVLGVVSLWGIRLTVNWIRGWKGLKHEDWRYFYYRQNYSRPVFELINFFGLQMMPTVMVFAGCLSLYPALVINPIGYSYVFDTLGLVVAVGATAIELLADEQMKRFCRNNKSKGKIMDKGLWSVSRHPNYFGEVSFWWGLYFFALAADMSYWWCFAGPLAITILFIVVSIPLMEKRQLARRPNFEEYKERVSVFIPWFPKKKKKQE